MKHLLPIKIKLHYVIMLGMGFLFSGCSQFYDDKDWPYFGDKIGNGFMDAVALIIIFSFMFALIGYFFERSGASIERDRVYVNDKEYLIERMVLNDNAKKSHSESFLAVSKVYSFGFFIALWLLIYGSVLFIFKTELHWLIDTIIALVSLWLTYMFCNSNFYKSARTLIGIISFVTAIIVIICTYF